MPRELMPSILQAIAEGIIVWDASGRMLYANDRAARMCGYESAEELGQAPREAVLAKFELLDDNGDPQLSPFLPVRHALEGRGGSETLVRWRVKGFSSEHWSIVDVVPIANPDGTVRAAVASFRDITNEILARRVAEESGLRQSFLAEASHQLASSLDYETTLATVARLAVPRIADWCTVDLIDAEGVLRRLAVAHPDPARVELAEALQRRYPVASNPPRVLQTGAPELIPVITEEILQVTVPDEERRQIVRDLGLHSAMILPLIARGRILGVLTFVSAESGRQYTERDLEFAEELTHRAALSVDNARLYRELDERVLQRTHELEEQLSLTREQARLLELAPDAILVRAWESRAITYWSHGAEQIYGWSKDEAMGQDVHALLQTRFPRPLATIIAELERMGHWEGELVHVRRDGSPVTVSSRWVLQRNQEGAPISFLEINTDIGPLKRAEEEHAARLAAEAAAARTALLAESSRVFAEAGLEEQHTLDAIARWVAEAIGDSCVIRLLSHDGTFLNPVAVSNPDPERLRILQETVSTFPHPASQQPAATVLKTGKPLRIPVVDTERLHTDLAPEQWPYIERLTVSSLLYTPISVHGSVIGILLASRGANGPAYTEDDEVLLQSVADRAAMAIENARLYQEAVSALHVRDEFLAVAAHELKTPITGIRLAADLFLRSAERSPASVPAGMDRLARNVREQAIKLAHLVGQLLDVSRIEAGRLALDPSDVDLADLLAGVVTEFRERDDGGRLLMKPLPPTPARVDPVRVEQVIVNLLENARKYSASTQLIEVEGSVSDNVARIAVRDYGPGVAEEHRERIFDRFYQVDPLVHAPGLGLGLYISRQIAQLHGGDLVAEFPADGGSRFILTLPALTSAQPRFPSPYPHGTDD